MSMVVGKRSEIKHSLISASFLEKIRFRSFDSCREWSVSMVVRECSEIKNSLRSTFLFGKRRCRGLDNCRESSVAMAVGKRSEIKNILISASVLETDVFAASIVVGSRVFRWCGVL